MSGSRNAMLEREDDSVHGASASEAACAASVPVERKGQGIIHRLFGGYAELLRVPHAARFTIGSVIACMPLAMIGMSITIGVQQIYGSYTFAGALSAVYSVSFALLSPQLGKLADRFGQRAAAIPAIIIWTIASQVFIAAANARVPEWVLFCIVPFLAFIPPWAAMSRARWRHLLKGDERRISTSLSLCSVFDECMWVVGNPLSSTLAVISGALAMRFGAICAVIGAVMVLTEATTMPPSQRDLERGADGASRDGRREVALAGGAFDAIEESEAAAAVTADLASPASSGGIWGPGMIALLAIYFGLGAFQNATGVSIVSFAREAGVPQVSGLVIACFSVSSLTGALFFGAISWKTPLWRRFYTCLVVLAIGLSLFVLAPNLWMIGAIYLVVGLCQAPIFINGNEIIMHLVSPLRFTEAIAWSSTLYSIGCSCGSAIAGPFIDAYGHTGGFAMVAVLALVTLGIGLMGVKQVRASTAGH